MSWTSAASRTTGCGGRGVDRPRACDPRGPRPGSCSGRRRAARRAPARRPRAGRCPRGAAARPTAAPRRGSARAPWRSARRRGGRRAARTSRIAASVAGSIVEAERRREADGPEHPQRVLLEPRARVADRAQRPRARRPRARRTGRPGAAACAGRPDAPQAIALTVKSRRARSASSDVAELDPVRPPEVGVVVVAPERRDLVASPSPRGRRPSRTRSRRRRRGRAPHVCSGRASVARSQSSPAPAERRCRAASRRRRTPRGRPPTASRGVADRGRDRAGDQVRSVAGAPAGVASVPAQEQVRPPGLVALVGEVRREHRVDVAARLERRPVQPEARLLERLAALAVVARLAGGDEVLPACVRRRDGAGRCGRGSGRGSAGRSTGRCGGRGRRSRAGTA